MSLNQDGLEPGQIVDFETLSRIKAKQRGAKDERRTEEKREVDDGTDEPKPKNSFGSTRKKKA